MTGGISDLTGARDIVRRSGHAEISWSLVLDTSVDRLPPAGEATERLRRAWPPAAGPAPSVDVASAEDAGSVLHDLANRPYAEGEPLARVVVLDADEPHVVVAGHHAAVDGLGLVALLSVVLDAPLATNARGLDPARMPRSATLAYRARRLIEAALAPPARIAPHSREADAAATGPGDHLTARGVATQPSTSRLVAAAARGVRRWNAAAGEAAEPLVVAVGASLRPGTEARLADLAARSAWFRLRIDRADPEEIAAKLARDAPEPRPSGRGVGPATLRLSRALASRLGSTLLVSNIGRMDGSGRVRRAALYPAAHGRSGVSIGCAAVGTEALVTLRARKSSFSARVAGSLLDVVVEELERLP